MPIRRTPETVPALSAEVVSILLAGWSAPHPPELSPQGFGGGFLDLVEPGGAGFIQFWTQHEAWLRQKAAAWGWAPEWEVDGRPAFYAEYVAHKGDE